MVGIPGVPSSKARLGKGHLKLPEPSEHSIQLGIMQWLALHPEHYTWRNNSGKLPTKSGRLVSFGKVGSADILGVSKDGRIIALEVKRPSTRKHTTPAQDAFLEEITKRGGIAGVVCSIEDVQELLT